MVHSQPSQVSRRDVLKGAATLVVTLGMAGELSVALAAGPAARPAPTADQLDSWIAVHADGNVTAFFGKIDGGQGLDVAVAQMVAEELDLAVARVQVVMGDTARTVNQGGASGSTGVQKGGVTLRNVAAEARRVLVELAGLRMGVPPEQLTVSDGVVGLPGDAVKRLSYGQILGNHPFDRQLDWNGKLGNDLVAKGKAVPKRPDQYQVVGQPVPRRDVAAKVFARAEYVTDVKLPGMLHGRMIRPPAAGAMPQAVDESSIRAIKGARLVWKNGFLGVVAPREWDAIRAAQMLAVTWSTPQPPFPDQPSLYDHIRRAPVVKRQVEAEKGNVEAAMAGAARVIEAEYEWPFQSHASMGPACAVADVREGGATVWTGSQKPHYARDGVAAILGLPPEKVHGIWVLGPGSYGRNDAGDAAIDAALLSQAVGRPVRLQGMRHEGHAWDPKGPASVHRIRAGLDQQGKIVSYRFESKGLSRIDINSHESHPSDSLAGHLMGLPLQPHQGFGVPQEAYDFPNRLMAWETIPPLLDRASPLRTSHLRDPVGPQIHFAAESFIDELAAATGSDAVEFRLRHLSAPRDVAVVKAAAERAGWQTRPSASRRDEHGETAAGRGIAYVRRSGTIVAVVAEVEVDRQSGKVWAKRFVVAHDCGLIINPDGLRLAIEGNIVQGTSRALWEQVNFQPDRVTSVDWDTYPILDISETPQTVDIVLINRPEIAPSGAGEPSMRPVAAAIGNAIFDATGVRLRRVPFTPQQIKAVWA